MVWGGAPKTMSEKRKDKKTSTSPALPVTRVSKVSRVLNQARESLKLLETLEKETLAKAKTFVRKPISASSRGIANEKIAASLRALGVVTRTEFERLERKIDGYLTDLTDLKAAILGRKGQGAAAEVGVKTVDAADTAPTRARENRRPASAESFPNT